MRSIRPARLADLPALLALEQGFPGDRLSARSFRHFLGQAHADVYVHERSGQVNGNVVVLYRKNARSARLYSIVVDGRARGQGIGAALLVQAEAAARRRGCEEMRLEVRADNNAALALYAARGYRVIRRLRGYYEDGAEGLRLAKRLSLRPRDTVQAVSAAADMA